MQNIIKNTDNPSSLSDLPPEKIHQIIEEKDKSLIEKDEQIKTLSTKLSWFEEQFKLLKSQRYARSSEKHHPEQAKLFDENEEETQTEPDEKKETITYERKKPNRSNKHIDTSGLPREKRVIDLSDAEKTCACGHDLDKIGEDTKEELVFVPAKLKVIEHIRLKYTCRHCQTVKAPAAIELPLLKSKAGAPLLTQIILNKYAYHLPLYRQRQMMQPLGIDIPDNTLGGWVMQCAEQLEPLREAYHDALNTARLLQADETPVKVLKPEKQAYMWLYHSYLPGKRFVLFEFSLSRAAENVNQRLKHFKGILQTDGYSGYNTQRKREDIISLGCWDHARRKFMDVVKASGHNKSGKAGTLLEKIAKLYEIENHIKSFTVDERKTIRQQQAKPKLEVIRQFLDKIHAPPTSLLGKAVTYCKNQWTDLIRYIDYGEAHISNCWVENLVRPFALGRRNWLFVGNEVAASRAALLYSLIQSCKLNDIDPRAYLEYVLNQVHRLRRKELEAATLLPHVIDRTLITNS